MTEPDTLFTHDPLAWMKPWQRHDPPSVHHSQTSMDAATSIKPKVQSLREKVLELLKTEALTDEQIATRLNLNPSTSRPRRIELTNMGLVQACGTAKTASGRTAQLWRATPMNADR